MYKTREVREVAKQEKGGKLAAKETWFRGTGGYTTTLKVPATPNGDLKKMIEMRLMATPAPNNTKVKVVEAGGRSTRETLVKSDPFPLNICERKDCPIVKEKEECFMKCHLSNINYTISCTRCDAIIKEKVEVINNGGGGGGDDGGGGVSGGDDLVDTIYRGESSRSIYSRYTGGHMRQYKDHNNMMWDHTMEAHGGVVGQVVSEDDYKVEVVGTDRDPIRRIICEAVRIKSTILERDIQTVTAGGETLSVKTQLLNGKNEWYFPQMIAVSATEM